jgi:ribosome-associated heat shock protein Hsp15
MADGETPPPGPGRDDQRLDKWLWFARVAKTRTLAARLVAEGKIRLNRVRVVKPSHAVKPGDVVTASVGRKVRVLRIVAAGARRGPPSEAALLFEELTAAADVPISAARNASDLPAAGARAAGSGRPTKRDRREINRLKGRDS